jgi:hypothetical protein
VYLCMLFSVCGCWVGDASMRMYLCVSNGISVMCVCMFERVKYKERERKRDGHNDRPQIISFASHMPRNRRLILSSLDHFLNTTNKYHNS